MTTTSVRVEATFTFTQGVVLGQLSIFIVVLLFLKFVVFEDDGIARQRAKRLSDARKKRRRERTSSARPIPTSLDNPTSTLLSSLAYDLPNHPPESLDWMNVLSAQIVIAYRNFISNTTTGHGGARGFMEDVLNRKGNGEVDANGGGVDGEEQVEGLVGIDRIEVGEVELGEKFPVFSNARVRPSGSDGGVRIEIDVDYYDHVHLAISTCLLVNFPRPRFAILPISLGLTLEHFSGTITLELPSLAAIKLPSPQMQLSLHPDFTLDISTTSLLGSRAKLQDIPKVEQLILARIRGSIQDRVVWPGRIDIGLPAIMRTLTEELDGGWIEVSFDESEKSEMAEREADEDEQANNGEGPDQDTEASDGGPSIGLRKSLKRRSQQIPFPIAIPATNASPTSSVPGTYTPKSPLRYQAPDHLKNFNQNNSNLRYRNSGSVGVGVGMMSPTQSFSGRVH